MLQTLVFQMFLKLQTHFHNFSRMLPLVSFIWSKQLLVISPVIGHYIMLSEVWDSYTTTMHKKLRKTSSYAQIFILTSSRAFSENSKRFQPILDVSQGSKHASADYGEVWGDLLNSFEGVGKLYDMAVNSFSRVKLVVASKQPNAKPCYYYT